MENCAVDSFWVTDDDYSHTLVRDILRQRRTGCEQSAVAARRIRHFASVFVHRTCFRLGLLATLCLRLMVVKPPI
jgi:hypothetical protein